MVKIGKSIFLFLCFVFALPMAFASVNGFTLTTSVTLDFSPSRSFVINSTATAVITFSGSVETGGAGQVTIVGRGGPTGVTIPSATANLPAGGNMAIQMPDQAGTYYYKAIINRHTASNVNDHTGHVNIESAEIAVTVYNASIQVRAKKSDGSGVYAGTASICAGGKDSNAHISEVEVTVNPPTSGVAATVLLSGGAGYNNCPALLTMSSGTSDSNGKIRGELRSSNRVESATLSCASESVTVNFDWNVSWTWTSQYNYVQPTNTQTLTLSHHGEPVTGHTIEYKVLTLSYFDASFNYYETSEASTIAQYAYFSPTSDETDSSGIAESTLYSTGIILEEYMVAYDKSVLSGSVAEILNGTAFPTFTKGGNIVEKIDAIHAGGNMQIYGTPAVGNTPASGTMPISGSKVSPGQVVTFQLVIIDNDRIKLKTWANGADFQCPLAWSGDYTVKLTLTNAKFAGNTTTKTVTATRIQAGVFVLSNQIITVDNPLPADVTVAIEVTDSIIIPAPTLLQCPAGTANTACQDPVWNGTITWPKATVFPTTVTPDNQLPTGALGTDVAQTAESNGVTVFYNFGTDLNGAANNAANYQNTTVDERFGTITSNIQLNHLTAAYQTELSNNYGITTDAGLRSALFPTGNNTTFTIGSDDRISDFHSGNTYLAIEPKLSAAGKAVELYDDLSQWYEVNAGTRLNATDYVIRRGRKAGNAASYFVKKTH